MFLDVNLEDNKFCTERQQTFLDFNLLLFSPWPECWFIGVLPKYLNCSILPNDALPIFMLSFYPEFSSAHLTVYSIFSSFTSRLNSSQRPINYTAVEHRYKFICTRSRLVVCYQRFEKFFFSHFRGKRELRVSIHLQHYSYYRSAFPSDLSTLWNLNTSTGGVLWNIEANRPSVLWAQRASSCS
jgi:hypothetical protein